MQATDRIYFMDPVQAPTLVLPEHAKIVAFETYRMAHERNFNPGDIIEVNGVSFDGGNRAWYVGADGNWYDGAIINHSTARQNSIGWYGDGDLTIFGRRSPFMTGQDNVFTVTRRSDQRRFGINGDIDLVKTPLAVKAAPWADHLFPRPYDRPEVVEAKLAQAKLRWEHHRKHAFIIREGMHRGWLTYLKEDGLHTDHGMPTPRWDLLAEGTISIVTTTVRTVARDEALAALPGQLGELVGRMAPTRVAPQLPVQEMVSVGYRTTLHVRREFENRGEVSNATDLVREQVRERIANYNAEVTAPTIRPILSELVPSV